MDGFAAPAMTAYLLAVIMERRSSIRIFPVRHALFREEYGMLQAAPLPCAAGESTGLFDPDHD
jgi:hypothetical protein